MADLNDATEEEVGQNRPDSSRVIVLDRRRRVDRKDMR